jgi:hypothetical protein
VFQPQNLGGGDQQMCEITVAGKPQPPLSFAFVASGGGSTVDVPFVLEHVAFSK